MGTIVEECKHGLTRQWCSHCKDRPAAESRNARLWNHPGDGPSFDADGIPTTDLAPPMMEANFDSLCPACGIEIEEGDIIAKRDDEWICAPCAYTYDVAERNAKACHPSNMNPGNTHRQHPSGGVKNA